MKSPFCYLTQNPTKSLCQPSDSMNFNFLEFADFCLFCAGFSDNLVTVSLFWPLAHMSVTSAGLIPLQQQALGAKSAIRAVTNYITQV